MNMLDCSFPCNHLTKLDGMGTLVLLCRTRLAVDVMMPMRLSAGAAALGHIPHHVCNLGWNLFALFKSFYLVFVFFLSPSNNSHFKQVVPGRSRFVALKHKSSSAYVNES
jgi:hypothetical protein